MSEIKVSVAGDLVPDEDFARYVEYAQTSAGDCRVYQTLAQSDISIVNLECPLVDALKPAKKSGPSLGVETSIIKHLKFIDVFNLANNHIMDHGSEGLDATIRAVESIGSEYVGVGATLTSAIAPKIVDVNGFCLAILSICESEFSVATASEPGAALADPIKILRAIRDLGAEHDALLVIVHGGLEHLRTPTPRLRELAKWLVEIGADAVVCQHTHCVGCYETYMEKPIIYGHGNFYFPKPPTAPSHWFEGCLVNLYFDRSKRGSVRFEPFPFKVKYGEVQCFIFDEAAFMNDFMMRSESLSDAYVLAEFDKFVSDNADRFLSTLWGKGAWWRRLRRLTNRKGFIKQQPALAAQLNTVRAESLRDAVIRLLVKAM